MRSLPSLSVASLAVALLVAPTPAHADGGAGVVGGIAGVSGAVLGVPMLAGGLITGVHNVVTDGRPTPAWRNTGYVFGGLNLAASAAWLAFAGVEERNDPLSLRVGLGLGLSHLVMGGLGVGLTVAGDRERGPHMGLTPIVLTDAKGRLAAGAGVHVMRF